MDGSRCFLPVCHGGGEEKRFTESGIHKLILCAHSRGDVDTKAKLQDIIDVDGNAASIVCHKGCYCTYTSKEKINRVKNSLKRKAEGECVRVATRSFQAQADDNGAFCYKRDCIFCGDECLPKDDKHPDRWDRFRECMTHERYDKEHNPLQSMKDVILEVAEQRNDDIARRVKLHIGFVSDLSSAECKYHVRCYNNFMKIPKYADLPTGNVDDNALKQIVIRVDGCATLVGYRESIAKTLKVVQVVETDEKSSDSLLRKIKREARSVKYNSANYDLSEFTRANTIKATSPTLLTLISDLVSGGEVTKKSLSLSQSIQSHITGTRNQTKLGLGVKLQHRYGSSELIKLLHEHGFISTYDEVLRFRKSAARFLGDNAPILHQFMGLSRSVGIIFAWFDNLDLQVFAPNGRRSTHVLSHEFQQLHPAGIPTASCKARGKQSHYPQTF
ncbi:Hypothetical predicted protein [Paramuricea clavata]|uniref:Uncharacterized protein n=1 Tax=Paramuricea clavata TaxID=317549 RepID=A0A6S7KYT8_PARCT|nr:Hypothetical predicted protein [Paramuricea clavata]